MFSHHCSLFISKGGGTWLTVPSHTVQEGRDVTAEETAGHVVAIVQHLSSPCPGLVPQRSSALRAVLWGPPPERPSLSCQQVAQTRHCHSSTLPTSCLMVDISRTLPQGQMTASWQDSGCHTLTDRSLGLLFADVACWEVFCFLLAQSGLELRMWPKRASNLQLLLL